MKVGIIGFGDLGQQLYHFLRQENRYSQAVFYIFDDFYHSEDVVCNRFSDFKNETFKDLEFFAGLGYKHLQVKKEILQWLEDHGRVTGKYIHPSVIADQTALIEPGTFIYPGCVIDQRVKISRGALLNNGVIVSHDTQIGNSCFLSPGVVVCGKCTIGDLSFVGAGSIVSNGISVGEKVTIGVGSVVAENLEDEVYCIGNPLKIKKKLTLK